MVTKSLLDKILSKTVKRKELNALSVSKEDRDRIYNNIINGGGSGSGSGSSDKVDLFDLVDVVGVNVFYRSQYKCYCIPYITSSSDSYKDKKYTSSEISFGSIGLLLSPIFSKSSLTESYTIYSMVDFDFDNNKITINEDNLNSLECIMQPEYYDTYNPDMVSPCRALWLIKKNVRYIVHDTYNDIDINVSDKLNELKNMNNRKMILNPEMSNEMKTTIINALTSRGI